MNDGCPQLASSIGGAQLAAAAPRLGVDVRAMCSTGAMGGGRRLKGQRARVEAPESCSGNVTRLLPGIGTLHAVQGSGASRADVPVTRQRSFRDLSTRHYSKYGSLVRLFEHEFVARDGYYFVYRKGDEALPDIQALRAWILQTFASNK
jgi:hypothetical protein